MKFTLNRVAGNMQHIKDMSEKKGAVPTVMERRRWSRLTVAIPMFVRGTDQFNKPFVDFGTALNIGPGGALLVLRRALQTGTQVSLEIPVGLLPQALAANLVQQIQARPLRVEPAENSYVIGVQFINPLPA
jgi:hypothetical protein